MADTPSAMQKLAHLKGAGRGIRREVPPGRRHLQMLLLRQRRSILQDRNHLVAQSGTD
jgi:hypothetical protein